MGCSVPSSQPQGSGDSHLDAMYLSNALPPMCRGSPLVPPWPPHLIGAHLQPEALGSGTMPNWMSPHYEIFALQANREAGIWGEGMIFLFIPGGGRTDKGSHSIPSLETRSSGKVGFMSERAPLTALSRFHAKTLKAANQFQLLVIYVEGFFALITAHFTQEFGEWN